MDQSGEDHESNPTFDVDPAVFETGPPGDALETMDRIFVQYDESATIEVAEQTYLDVTRGITNFSEMFFYIDRDLEDLKASLPGSVFSELGRDEPLYALCREEITLYVRFGKQHRKSVRLPTRFEAIELRLPTERAMFAELYSRLKDRIEE